VSIAFAEPHLYAVQNTKLWRVDPRSGDFRRLGSTTWTKEARCASDGRRLYVLDGALHEVDVRTGELRRSTSPMWRVDPMAIACGAGAVFVIENGRLHRIDDAR
jgi:hypothetical protein